MVVFLAQYRDAISMAGIAHVQQLAFDPVGGDWKQLGLIKLVTQLRVSLLALSARQMQRAILAAHGMRQLALPM